MAHGAMTSPDRALPRAVVDTNAVLDWLVFREPAGLALREAIGGGRHVWCVTPPMLDELRAVLSRPLAERWEPARKLALTVDLRPLYSECMTPLPLPASKGLVCRDATDQMFIDLALASAPAWLITRDRALLALRRRAAALGVVVATPEQWLQRQTVDAPAAETDHA
jgi:putative PIN family toxin of toxin-antitoxin system